MDKAIFLNANLAGTDMESAVITGADLSLARGLTQAQLDAACGDEMTRLPPGLEIKECP